MKKIKFFLFFLTFLWAFPLNAATNKPVVSKPSPEDWLVKKGQELVTILSEQDTKTRYLKLRKIAKEVFNKGEMTRLAMGRHWRTLIFNSLSNWERKNISMLCPSIFASLI